jgi:hypothetical protein
MKETVVHVWDDLAQANGEKVTATDTIVFAVDDQTYAIDLGPDNAAEFRATLDRYIAVSEKLGRQRPADGRHRQARSAPVRNVALPPLTPVVRLGGTSGRKPKPKPKPSQAQRSKYRERAAAWVLTKYPDAKVGRLSDALYTDYEEHCRRAGIDP